VPGSLPHEQDILKLPSPKRPPRLTSRRIGIHTSSAGGVQLAAERAYRLGCNAFQIFSSSPRQWAPHELDRPQCEQMKRLRDRYDLKPLVIHTNYLVNLAGVNELFLKKSVEAFRGEIDRALALCAEYLVLHPGSFRGSDREQGLMRTAAAIAAAPKAAIKISTKAMTPESRGTIENRSSESLLRRAVQVGFESRGDAFR